MAYCDVCIYSEREPDDLPCKNCIFGDGIFDYFVRIKKSPEQPTTPPVNPPKEEIDHPSRYAGGKYECIDVMVDVFGVDATKHFCLLNAFKYIWRQEHKNGVEDIKKASWYLNKYIELSENTNENV